MAIMILTSVSLSETDIRVSERLGYVHQQTFPAGEERAVTEPTRTKGWQIQESTGASVGIRRAWTVLLSLALLTGLALFVYWTFKPVRPLNTHFAQLIVQGYSSEAGLMDPAYAGSGIVGMSDKTLDKKRLKNWKLHGKLEKRSEDVTLSQILPELEQKLEAAKSEEEIDVLLFYVSAHGLVVGGEPVLLASNFDYASHETSGHLPIEEFLNQVANLPVKHCIVLLDASHLESQLRHGVLTNGFLGKLEIIVRDKVPDNVWVVTGNAMLQPSHVSSASKRSLFSTSIGEAWTRQSDKRGIKEKEPDDQLSLGEFYDAVLSYCFSQSQGSIQTPLLMQGKKGLCDSKENEIYKTADKIVVSEFLAPLKKKKKDSGQASSSPSSSPRSHDLFAEIRRYSQGGLAMVQPANANPQDKTKDEGGGANVDTQKADGEATKSNDGEATGSANGKSSDPPVETGPPKPTVASNNELPLAWWYRDRLANRRDSAWSPVDFAPHYWRAVNDQLIQLEGRRRFGASKAVGLDDDIRSIVLHLEKLHDAMQTNRNVVDIDNANTSYPAVQTCLAWNHFRTTTPHSDRKRQWEDRKTWSEDQLTKWENTQGAIRDYTDISFDLSGWVQLYERASTTLDDEAELFNGASELAIKLDTYRDTFEQSQYDLDEMAPELVRAANDISDTSRVLRAMLENEVTLLVDKESDSAGTWAWECQVRRLMRSWILSYAQRRALATRWKEVSIKPLTLLNSDRAWNEVNNDGTSWQEVINTSKLLSDGGNFYFPSVDDVRVPRPIKSRSWAESDRFSKEYRDWLVALSRIPPEPDSMANWRWANQLHPNETAVIAANEDNAGFVSSVIAAPNNSGLMLQFSKPEFVQSGSQAVRFESIALGEKSVFVDVKSQGSRSRVDRCQFKIQSIEAEAVANAFEITIGGDKVDFTKNVSVTLADGELDLKIRPLRDTRQANEQFAVKIQVSTNDGNDSKWSNAVTLRLSPPPPDHVDLYLSLGDNPRSRADFARNIFETQDGIHATIDEKYLRLRGFPTIDRGSLYRMWLVDRSGLRRRIRVRLFAIPHPAGNTDRNRGAPLEPGRVLEFPDAELSRTLLSELSPDKVATMLPFLETIVESKDDKIWGAEYDEPGKEFEQKAQRLVFSKPSGDAGDPQPAVPAPHKNGWPINDGVLCILDEIDAEGKIVEDPSRDRVNGQFAPKAWWKWIGVGSRFPAGDYVEIKTHYEPQTRKIVAELSAEAKDLVRLGIKKGVKVTASCSAAKGTDAKYVDQGELSGDLIAAQPSLEFSWQLRDRAQEGDMHLVQFTIDGYQRNITYQVRAEPNREQDLPGDSHDQEVVELSEITFWDRQGKELATKSSPDEIVLSKEVKNEAGDWLPVIYDKMTVRLRVDAPGEFDNLASLHPDQVSIGLWRADTPYESPSASRVEVRHADRRTFSWVSVGNDGLLSVLSTVEDHEVEIGNLADLASGKYELRAFLRLKNKIVPDPRGVQRITVDREPPIPAEVKRGPTKGDSSVVYKDKSLTIQLTAKDELSDVVGVEFRIDGRDSSSPLGAVFNKNRGIKLPTDGVIASDGTWTLVIPADLLKNTPAGQDRFIVAQTVDAAGNRQDNNKPFRFRVSTKAATSVPDNQLKFAIRPIVNEQPLDVRTPKKGGVSVRVGGQGPERVSNGKYWFRNKPGKHKVDIRVEFRSNSTYVSPKDYEVTVEKDGASIDIALMKVK